MKCSCCRRSARCRRMLVSSSMFSMRISWLESLLRFVSSSPSIVGKAAKASSTSSFSVITGWTSSNSESRVSSGTLFRQEVTCMKVVLAVILTKSCSMSSKVMCCWAIAVKFHTRCGSLMKLKYGLKRGAFYSVRPDVLRASWEGVKTWEALMNSGQACKRLQGRQMWLALIGHQLVTWWRYTEGLELLKPQRC